ncbi:MAG: EVE domain-containing protein [Planctomycetes bacterium]|nr:EVE domain-containing protein [Planctomycetota bacterium]
MPTWLVKTEPSTYGFADLQREKKTVWSGVANNAALLHLRQIRKGDAIFVYHTGDEKAVVALAMAVSDSYPDPKEKDPKLAVFDIAPVRALKKQVTLAQIKADKRFKEFGLVKISRLSVMPVPPEIEAALMKLAGE